MARDEFIRRYMERSGVTDYAVDGDRIDFDGCTLWAFPCDCNEEGCEGWQMVGRKNKIEGDCRWIGPQPTA